MSHPNPSGNGCSLEDCYTNLFALTDLCGIRWRKLIPDPDSHSIDPLGDPVLVAYSKCIRSDILCVWRRVPVVNRMSDGHPGHPGHHHGIDHMSYGKELWIFWYGDEPKVLADFLKVGLHERDIGSWDKDKDKDSGLSYECRTLLFKALHNLIERCLLSKNFIRLGHWFVRPYDQFTSTERSAHLSFRFHFFLHGESQVCASIEVKQHPPVWRLTPQYLSLIQENQANFQVILAPYGLNGQLTGNSYRESDVASRRMYEEWRQFYPVDSNDYKSDHTTDANNKLPNMVEVIVAGVRMKYPSCYVMICDNDDSPVRLQPLSVTTGSSQNPHYSSITPPTSPCDPSLMADVNVKMVPNTMVDTQFTTSATSDALSHHILERVSHHVCINSGMAKRNNEGNEEPYVGLWNYGDSTCKMSCNCVRHRKMKAGQGKNLSGKHAKSEKQEKLERQLSRHGRNVTPFHRRSLVTDDMLQFDMNIMMTQQPQNNSNNFCGSGGNNNLPSGQNNLNDSNIDDPCSPPSPLDEPQPLVNSNMEPPMPTLSPHPPPKINGEKDYGVKSSNVSDISNGVCGPNGEFFPKQEEPPLSGLKVESCDNTFNWTQSEAKRESVNLWLQSQQKQVENLGLKRPPLLPTFEGDKSQEDLVTDSLYNLDPLNAWIELPIKKSRIDCSSSPCHPPDLKSPSHSDVFKVPTPSPPVPDPYEFSDEASFNPKTLISTRKSRDEMIPRQSPFNKMDDDSGQTDISPFGSPPTPNSNLMRTADLAVKSSDLDHMFDSDDSSDQDDAGVSVHALINFDDDFMCDTNTAKRLEEDIKSRTCPGNIAPSELARMFPTPPSQEPNKALSPEADVQHDSHQTLLPSDIVCYRSKVSTVFTVPEDISRQDVFKPPKTAKFVSAPKYSPIELPSRQLSPINMLSHPGYKPSWQYPMSVLPIEKQQPVISSYINLPSIENVSSCLSRTIPSPATFTNINSNQQRTPMSYELQSPASNASSYLNKTLNSVDNQPTNHQIPEVHSLLVNVLLSDSLLNLYKDHNFDSCNICVCNFDIKGADVGPYLPDIGNSESGYNCMCGFSAVINRKYGYHSGLFYEDEVDITGIRESRFDKRKHSLLDIDYDNGVTISDKEEEDIPPSILKLLIEQFTVPFLTNVAEQRLAKLNMITSTTSINNSVDVLQLKDGNEVSYNALEQGRQAMENTSPTKLDDPSMRMTCLHKWPFLRGANRIPVSSQDIVNLHKSLQPILQDAIQNKRVTRMWEHSYKLQGPLTWKDFHQLAGRGSDENCEPQPIPYFLVGNDADWLTVSPYSLRYWDKQVVEPFAKARDIAYLVVAPENDFILTNVQDFFKELSTVYKLCRLGKHNPISSKIRDGIMRVGKSNAHKVADDPVDDWFKNIGDSQVAQKLRLYARVCRHLLGPYLKQLPVDGSLFEGASGPKSQFKTPEPASTHPPTPENPGSNNPEDKDSSNTENASSEKPERCEVETEEPILPAIVIYMIDPFAYGNDWEDLNRLTMIGLLRCFQQMLQILPEHIQNNISLQIVPLKTILGHKEDRNQFQALKSMAFSVFTTCRWNLSHTIMGRSLTGFGPAAAAQLLLKRKESENQGQHLYTPPFILAPLKDKQAQLAESCGGKTEKGNVLFCGYCLSEDQRWLLAVVTDERGELMETCVVNIEIPNRNRRKKTSARIIGLRKLWDFVVGIVSVSRMAARIVIGRFGRIGHGELKGWSGLLSKKNLLHVSHKLKDMCGQCEVLNNSGAVPSILSACLVSLEPHSSFQIMADAMKAEEKMSSNCPLQTPRDASATHILVFPISATAQANSMPLQPEGQILDFNNTQLDINDDALFGGLKDEDLGQMDQGMDLFDVFNMDNMDYTGVPGTSPPGSPSGGEHGRQNSRSNGPCAGNNGSQQADPQDDINLLQQPLAMGYYVSTARPGPMPKWFWSSRPENAHVCPNTFKAALHVHCSSSHDDFYNHSHTVDRNMHPLDSHLTCDVLRFVLENYNALSWLTYDVSKNDRRSCLPIHLDMLMQMYHAMSAFI